MSFIPNIATQTKQFRPSSMLFGSEEALRPILSYDPTCPLIRLRLANVIEANNAAKNEDQRSSSIPIQAAFLRHYDLDRMPDDADEWALAAKWLLELPDAQVGLAPHATVARDEALKAANHALTLDPHHAEAQQHKAAALAAISENHKD
ncbi:MAG: hypothetical protein Q8M16_13995 [Pirellulaceae bacterium]|nr:hypothetical protein [Pirellulaceae bacterium]